MLPHQFDGRRRRRWSFAEKQHLVAASLESGGSVSAVAREAGIHPSQLYGRRRQLRAETRIGFAAVGETVAAEPTSGSSAAEERAPGVAPTPYQYRLRRNLTIKDRVIIILAAALQPAVLTSRLLLLLTQIAAPPCAL